MCTVTYLPIGKSSFILTSNRDESQQRKIAAPPEKYSIYDTNVYFPKDTDANGTWFAAAETKFTLCLLKLGDNIKNRREALGYSQLNFAQKAGLSKGQLHKIEHGVNAITVTTLRRICVNLNTSIGVLCDSNENRYKAFYTEITKYKEWNFISDNHDWIEEETEQRISGFEPKPQLTYYLDNFIDTEKE